ncbi:MAG: hypothetical protein KAU20_00870 [Nanoarchaeota archaeon]|nr:hypothetical protein [Nanoarchaeota archaeon]
MKPRIFQENKLAKDVLLVLSIILGFVFIISFSAIYVSDAIKNNNACGCVLPIPYMILILASLGLFVGSLSFYILVSKHIKEKKESTKNIEFTLNFLEKDEKTIIEELIKNKGQLNQSKFEKLTNLHKVKIHRIIDKLNSKGLIRKVSAGKTNNIIVSDQLKEIFI